MIARAVYRLAFVAARVILDSGQGQVPGCTGASAEKGKPEPAMGRCGPQRTAVEPRAPAPQPREKP